MALRNKLTGLYADFLANVLVDQQPVELAGNTLIFDQPTRTYKYDASSTATHDGVNVIAPTSGVGRYLLQANPYYNGAISLTTTGSGAATLSNGVLNIPTPNTSAPGTNNAAGYGTGTAYNLTTTSAKITLGTTSPSITIPAAGTYLILANVTIDYSGLTTLAVAAANFKIRRTNNTPTDIANTSTNFNVPVVTLLTQTGGDADLNAVIYTTSNNNDVLELWGSRGAITVGNIQITNGYIVAVRIA